jgi:hypothetical protein
MTAFKSDSNKLKNFISIFLIKKMNAFKRMLSLKAVTLDDLKSSYGEFLNLLYPIATKRVSGTPENLAVNNVSFFFNFFCVAQFFKLLIMNSN